MFLPGDESLERLVLNAGGQAHRQTAPRAEGIESGCTRRAAEAPCLARHQVEENG